MFQSLHPMYNIPLAMVGEDQLLEGVVTVAIFVPFSAVSRMKMSRSLVSNVDFAVSVRG